MPVFVVKSKHAWMVTMSLKMGRRVKVERE